MHLVRRRRPSGQRRQLGRRAQQRGKLGAERQSSRVQRVVQRLDSDGVAGADDPPVLAGNTRDEGKLFPTFLALFGGVYLMNSSHSEPTAATTAIAAIIFSN